MWQLKSMLRKAARTSHFVDWANFVSKVYRGSLSEQPIILDSNGDDVTSPYADESNMCLTPPNDENASSSCAISPST